MGKKKEISDNEIIYITGDETVEELISKVDAQVKRDGKEGSTAVLTLIRSTTAITNPATYNQFLKRLRFARPTLYTENEKFLEIDTNQNKGFFSKLSNLFKNSKQETLHSLKKNNLGIMSSLIIQAEMAAAIRGDGVYVFSQQKKIEECEMLKNTHDVKKGPANESLNRFRWAKDICEENGYMRGSKLMQNYVDIYTLYLKEYC